MIAFIAAAALAGAIPDGTYDYEFRSGDVGLGSSTVTVHRSVASIAVHEVAVLSGKTFTIDETVDPATMLPEKLEAVYPSALPSGTGIHATYSGGTWTESVDGVAGTKSLAQAVGTKGALILDGPVMAGFFLAPAQAQRNAGSPIMGISPGSELTFTLTLAPADASSRPTFVPAADAGTTVGGLASGAITIWYDKATLVPSDFEIPSQGISVMLQHAPASSGAAPTPVPAPTPLPTSAPHFSSRDVAFVSTDDTSLAGTLTIPDGARRDAPAIVLVQGSGPVDRDERVGPNPIFLELSNALSNDGFVVLRYDKRGIGKSGGDAQTTTRDELLADARAAVDYVVTLPVVDRSRVYVVGHSEGGELAPSLAAGGAHLHGIVLMAPPALPLEDILLQQATHGLTGVAADQARAAESAAIAKIKAGSSALPGATWLRTSFGIDPADVIKRVPCPILVLQGGKDFQVLATDLPRLTAAARAAHRRYDATVFPDDDHLFITVPGSAPATVGEYLVPHRIDPAMVSTMLAWLHSH